MFQETWEGRFKCPLCHHRNEAKARKVLRSPAGYTICRKCVREGKKMPTFASQKGDATYPDDYQSVYDPATGRFVHPDPASRRNDVSWINAPRILGYWKGGTLPHPHRLKKGEERYVSHQ